MIQCLRIQREKSPCSFSFGTDRSVFTFTKYPPVTLSHEHSVAVIFFILFHKHPAHASPMSVPSVKKEGNPEGLSVYSVMNSQWEAKAKDTVLIQ